MRLLSLHMSFNVQLSDICVQYGVDNALRNNTPLPLTSTPINTSGARHLKNLMFFKFPNIIAQLKILLNLIMWDQQIFPSLTAVFQ
jgi:hypothetical protein